MTGKEIAERLKKLELALLSMDEYFDLVSGVDLSEVDNDLAEFIDEVREGR